MKTTKKPIYKEIWFIILIVIISPFLIALLIAVLPLLLVLSPGILIYGMWAKTNWARPTKIAISIIVWWFVLILIFAVVLSLLFGSKPQQAAKPVDSISAEIKKEEEIISKIFNLDALHNKKIDEISKVFWENSKEQNPTSAQISAGVNTWSKTFRKDGYFLLVNYIINEWKVVDFFVAPEESPNSSGLLSKKEIQDIEKRITFDKTKFHIKPVQAIKDKNSFTGITFVPVVDEQVETGLWLTRKYIMDALKKPSIWFSFEEWIAVKNQENYTWSSRWTVVQLLWPKEDLQEISMIGFLSNEPSENLITLSNIIGLWNLVDKESVDWITWEFEKITKNLSKKHTNTKKIWNRNFQITYDQNDYFNSVTLTIKK